ncbi:MAG: NADH-quinone oxidoreductase subunit N [Candidatus Omnitrophota bacterium]
MDLLLDLKFIQPEIILIIASILVLMLDFMFKSKRLLAYFSLFSLCSALLVLFRGSLSAHSLFSGMLVSDPLALFLRILSVFITAVVILISIDYQEIGPGMRSELYSLLLMSASAMMFLSGANNLLMIYLGIEFISLISYILAAYWKGNLKSSEAGLKYFLFGTACSITMLYGMSIIYGITGTLDLPQMNQALFNNQFSPVVIFIAILMVSVGLAFKVAMVPFHFWCPDVYEGAPTPVTAFFSVGPKLLGFAVLLRFLLGGSALFYQHWMHLLGILAIATMVVGNLTALAQTNIKRLLAYSSIAHAGYALIGLVVNTTAGYVSLFIYLSTYIVMNLGAFAVVIAVSNQTKSDEIKDYAGLSANSPYLAAMLSLFLISLAGIPPLAGFIGKFYIFSSALKEGFIYLAIAAVLNSVIAAYYYFNIIRVMYLSPASSSAVKIKPSPALNLALVLSLLLVLAIGLYPKPVIDWVSAALAFPSP